LPGLMNFGYLRRPFNASVHPVKGAVPKSSMGPAQTAAKPDEKITSHHAPLIPHSGFWACSIDVELIQTDQIEGSDNLLTGGDSGRQGCNPDRGRRQAKRESRGRSPHLLRGTVSAGSGAHLHSIVIRRPSRRSESIAGSIKLGSPGRVSRSFAAESDRTGNSFR